MRTWEIMQCPGKKFRRKSDGFVIEVTLDGTLYWDSGHRFLNINDEWEEVKEPVDFIEALKSCKRVSVEHPNLFDMPVIYKKNASIATVINYIFESYSDALVREIILNGKWYIED